MVVEIFLLALASTVRPTSLAAVSALVTRESRRRLMFAYVVGGLAFTMAFGVVVVGVFHGIHFPAENGQTKAVTDIVGGVVALLLGLGVLTRVIRRRPSRITVGTSTTWTARLDRGVTVRVAALAGPLTHVPGIFYLIALNVIVANNPQLPGGLVAVAVYNGIWFAVPIAALVLCMIRPDAASRVVVAVRDVAKRHARSIVVVTCLVAGVALIIRGALAL